MNYKLLTPGPLTTTGSVKRAMLTDHCTWDGDYKEITRRIRGSLLALARADPARTTAILMQGSGTFGEESVLSSVIGAREKLLIVSNGAYGQRIAEIARCHAIDHIHRSGDSTKPIDPATIATLLESDPAITHVAIVHCETTTGVVNDIETIGALIHRHGKTFIVDAMSSFGALHIPINAWHIHYLISSANKCIQGVPGFSFILADRRRLQSSAGHARTLSLDLHDQWREMERDGKWRFTSPTHTVLAFAQALAELEQEGGIPARRQRYQANMNTLLREMEALGFRSCVAKAHQSPIIATFQPPEGFDFNFNEFYTYIKQRGYAIYPGKLTTAETFRVGVIGDIHETDMLQLTAIIRNYLEEKNHAKN